jgi:hypothetical protein
MGEFQTIVSAANGQIAGIEMISMMEAKPVPRIVALTAFLMGLLFALSGLEEFFRTDPASSKAAGLVFVLVAVSLFGVARVARSTQDRDDRVLPILRSANPVFARSIASRTGQIGMAIFIAGAILSVLSAAILRLNIYSLVLFTGIPLVIVGLIWMLVMTVLAGVATFREARAEFRRRGTG